GRNRTATGTRDRLTLPRREGRQCPRVAVRRTGERGRGFCRPGTSAEREGNVVATPCVILDIGGVLELTPEPGWVQRWEERLRLPPGTVHERMRDVWQAGSVGRVSEREGEEEAGVRLGLSVAGVGARTADLWEEGLGAPTEGL